MKLLRLIAVIFLIPNFTYAQNIDGTVIFSIEIVESALGSTVGSDGKKLPPEKTGIYYYYKEPASPQKEDMVVVIDSGPTLTGYKFSNGKVMAVWGGGTVSSVDLLREIDKIPLSSFDVQEEIKKTIDDLKLKAQKRGTNYSPPLVLDGAKIKIQYNFKNVNLVYEEWNPGPLLDETAKYNQNIKNLNDLINLLAKTYGRQEFGL